MFFVNFFLMRCKNFLKVHENTGEKMFAKISLCRWLFRKNNKIINCDNNNHAICFLITGSLFLLGSPWNEISIEVLKIHLRSSFGSLSWLKFWFTKKPEDETAYYPDTKDFGNYRDHAKISFFSKDSAIV